MNSFLIIQTASVGDVILATSVAEKLHVFFPHSKIDFAVRKGCEGVFNSHPFIHDVLTYDKSGNKAINLKRISFEIRRRRYDCVINIHRFGSSAVMASFSGAKYITGFNKSPLWFLYNKVVPHIIGDGTHEIARNLRLIEDITNNSLVMPRLYPTMTDLLFVDKYKKSDFVCIAPASKWFTKQLPPEKWIELVNTIDSKLNIYLIGGEEDIGFCEIIHITSGRHNIRNLAGDLTILQTAALMKDAKMNYVNDSAPLHIASAVNAPVTAVFCSTVPEFGFGPLSDHAKIVQNPEKLDCRPCGLHGYHSCPKKHFRCATTIDAKELVESMAQKL